MNIQEKIMYLLSIEKDEIRRDIFSSLVKINKDLIKVTENNEKFYPLLIISENELLFFFKDEENSFVYSLTDTQDILSIINILFIDNNPLYVIFQFRFQEKNKKEILKNMRKSLENNDEENYYSYQSMLKTLQFIEEEDCS